MEKNRVIEIGGIQLYVDDVEYNYYWNAKRCGENSESYIIACRRLLGIGPKGNEIGISTLNFIGGSAAVQKLARSSIVSYEENTSEATKREVYERGAKYAIMEEQEINAHDDEFEPDLEL